MKVIWQYKVLDFILKGASKVLQ